jgi:hypothetical protein
MAKAKVTPAKLEPEQKQIVLTQEQFDELIKIYTALDEATDRISELVANDFNQIKLGYNLGMINNDLQRAYNTLDELTDAIDPDRESWFNFNDDDDTDLDPNK